MPADGFFTGDKRGENPFNRELNNLLLRLIGGALARLAACQDDASSRRDPRPWWYSQAHQRGDGRLIHQRGKAELQEFCCD